MKAADEPAYLTVGTDVSAKYRGAFCEAKIKTVKRLVKVKVTLKQDNSTQLVQDDQVKGPLRVGATVEMKAPDGSSQDAVISKLTDASWYTVVFDDGDERTLRRTSLCLKGERHFAESETLDQLPLTNPEHFGTPVIGKKTNRGRRSSLPMTEDEKEESSSEEEDNDVKRIGDELLGKVVCVNCSTTKECYPAVVVSPSCSDDTSVKKDQCLVRSFADAKFHSVARKDIEELAMESLKLENLEMPGITEAIAFFKTRTIPSSWKMDMSEILESSSSDEDGDAEASDGERNKEDDEAEPEEEADPVERDSFLQQLYKFMEDRGTPINKPPVLGYKDLNLFKLFRLVFQQGGCDNIESGAVWKQIYMDLGIPILNSAASYNVKTAYKKYLYGFEEYCRSAEIQFRTIHHNDPRPVEEIPAKEEPMEISDKKEDPDPPVNEQIKEDEDSDSNSENEKEETEVLSPRERQRLACNAVSVTDDPEDCEKRKENDKENKDVEEELEDSDEKKENDATPPGRRSLSCKSKERRSQRLEESDRESEEEEEEDEQFCDSRDDTDHKGDSEGDEDSDDSNCLTGTKVKVKYGRGKTQKIYEANIKNTEVDGGELLYLVHYYGWNVRYDEWVKADRIIWPTEKSGTKRKQKKRIKNKDEIDEKDDDRYKTKRGRPPLKSPLQTNVACTMPKTPNSENKAASKHVRSSLPDNNFLPNGLEGAARRRTRRSSGMYDSDRCSNDSSTSESDSEEPMEKSPVKEEILPEVEKECEQTGSLVEIVIEQEAAPVVCAVTDQEPSPVKPAETLQQEVEESEQIVQSYGKQTEPIVQSYGKQTEQIVQSYGKQTEPIVQSYGKQTEPIVQSYGKQTEQIVQSYGKQTEQIVEVKETENLPKKGRRSKTKEPCVEAIKSVPVPTEDIVLEPKIEPKMEPKVEPKLEPKALDFTSFASLQSKEMFFVPNELDLPNDQQTKEKKGFKRKPAEQTSPEKKQRTECEPELPVITAEEKPVESCETLEPIDIIKEEPVQDTNEEMPSLTMPSLTSELEHVQSTRTEDYEMPLSEITRISYKEEQEDIMPMIGPETLVCHEVDLDDFDEKDKVEDMVIVKPEPDTQTVLAPTLQPAILPPHTYSEPSPLALSHDESHSVKSESDITIEVDSVAEESQEGLCESESANGFEASTTSSNCSITAQEAEVQDKGHKRISDSNIGALAKKQKRTPKRINTSSKTEKNGIGQSSDSEDLSAVDTASKCSPAKLVNIPKPQKIMRSPARVTSPHTKDLDKDKHREKHQHSSRTYKWTLQLTELDNMNGAEKIVFLQDKLQEIRKYYMSLKSEVATIDRRRKRLKKKDREVSNTGASMSSASSETGMSPSSSSPPQNTLALECR